MTRRPGSPTSSSRPPLGTRWTWFALLVAALSLAAASGGKSDEEIEAELAATKRVATCKAVAKAQEVYVTRCTPCHGETAQ